MLISVVWHPEGLCRVADQLLMKTSKAQTSTRTGALIHHHHAALQARTRMPIHVLLLAIADAI